MTRKLWAGLALMVAWQSSAVAQEGTRNGAVLGGVSGAVIGGIIGHQNDEVPEGALIGGAVGAIAGGLIGNAREQQARQRYYQPQPQWTQPHHHHPTYNTYRSAPPRTTVVTSPGVSIGDVLAMTRNGVGESVIINHIYSTGLQRRVDTNEIIMLHQQGVSENVINAMQQAPLRSTYAGSATINGTASTTIVTPPGGTVIVQEQYGTPTYTPPTTYAQPSYGQPSYVQPNYARPSYYPSYPKRRGF